MAPVIVELRRQSAEVVVVATAQHREMLDQVLNEFDIVPCHDLDLMRHGQSLASFASRCLASLEPVIRDHRPTVLLAQGDTTTTFMSALAAFYQRVPFAHIEAGLRTGDIYSPYPEEFNRVAVSRLTDLHFAPTEGARINLLREGTAVEDIVVTGNTVIDALLFTRDRQAQRGGPAAAGPPTLLITVHRRENFGEPLDRICAAVKHILSHAPRLRVIWPVHPNPVVREKIFAEFASHPRVRLSAPLPYGEFVRSMTTATLILTDSGGIQEEAPALGKPVLVLREETERPEAVAMGVAALIGTNPERIAEATLTLLNDEAAYSRMAWGPPVYGDGHAAERIACALANRYGR